MKPALSSSNRTEYRSYLRRCNSPPSARGASSEIPHPPHCLFKCGANHFVLLGRENLVPFVHRALANEAAAPSPVLSRLHLVEFLFELLHAFERTIFDCRAQLPVRRRDAQEVRN